MDTITSEVDLREGVDWLNSRRGCTMVFGGVCNDKDRVVGERVTFRLLDGLIAVQFAVKRGA